MKVRFVTPRYGPEVIGGAESGARSLAEHLVSELGWEAEVLTTCARDHITWANELPAGASDIGGVRVRRFPTDTPRNIEGLVLDGRLRQHPDEATLETTRRWVDLNGPVSTPLVEAVLDGGVDVTVYYPYLYHPTVATIGAVPTPAVLHPAAHDEPALYFPVFGPVFAAADALVLQTRAERTVVERVHPVAASPQILLGLGIETPPARRRSGGDVLGLGERPYLVSVGRVDAHKGSRLLWALFTRYKEEHPGPLGLAFVGPVSLDLPAHPDVVVAGMLDESDKADAVRGAVASVTASALEAFSLVVPEAWALDVPVLVNARCGATREHCERSGGGLWFGSYAEFAAVLDRLVADDRLRRTLAANGRRYVDAHLRWPALIRRYARFLDAVVGRGRRRPMLNRRSPPPAR